MYINSVTVGGLYSCYRLVYSEVFGSSAVKFVSVTHALTSNRQLVIVLTSYVHLTNHVRQTTLVMR